MSVQATTASFPTQDAAACPYCGSSNAPDRPFCGTCGYPEMPLAAGSAIRSAYVVGEVLHSAPTGALYRATDKRRKREVAIKELLVPAGSTAQERSAFQAAFVKEVRRIASLKHPNLPAIVEHFPYEGRYYLVMEYVQGPDLRAFLQTTHHGFPEAQVRGYAQQLLGLLARFEAERPPFVHGEIAPENLVLRADGSPVLVGYGLGWRLGLHPRHATPEPGMLAPREGSAPGSLSSQPGIRDDLYGLGATLHSLLTGRDSSLLSSSALPFPPVREYAPRVSVGTAEIINRAVSPDRSQRFATPGAFRAALTPSFAVRSQPQSTRRPGHAGRVIGFVLALCLVALAAALAVYIQRTVAPSATQVASPATPQLYSASRHTLNVADTFLAPGAYWPLAAPKVVASNGELGLANPGPQPSKVLRAAYLTGANGFTLTASLRLTKGAPSSYYGIVALDHPGRVWENVALVITGNGKWALLRNHGGQVLPLSGWKDSGAIRRGHNTPNEVQLSLTPTVGGKAASFGVMINGVTVAGNIPAWSAALSGRVGFVTGPGSAAAVDSLTVAAPGPTKITVQDYFRNNAFHWAVPGSSSSVSIHGGLLQLSSRSANASQMALARGVTFAALPTTVTGELQFSLHARAGSTGQTAGLVFAGPGLGSHAPYLAAVVNAADSISVVSVDGSSVTVVAGPLRSNAVRSNAAPNTLRVRTTFTASAQNAQITVNGVPLLTYAAKLSGEQPAAGLLVTGNAAADASALRLSGRGIHVQ